MNKRQLLELGVPEDCVVPAITCIQKAARVKEIDPPKKQIPQIVQSPQSFVTDPYYGELAMRLVESAKSHFELVEIPYSAWGSEFDSLSIQQIRNACRIPVARAAALMPDAHAGYGLPIGGVLACENAVIPYAVGVDIACRMKLTVTDIPAERVEQNDAKACAELDRALQDGTRFGAGVKWKRPAEHPVLDEDWNITPVTRHVHPTAVGQLGTSGSGNHFVEWGVLTLPADDLGLPAGKYVALLSHSGSRGPGANVCRRYSELAMQSVPNQIKNDNHLKHLSWLSMDSEAGQEYWLAMNLMGRFASANHEVIHNQVTKLAGAQKLATVENHHNFAWLEEHDGNPLYVHRKGATPAAKGDLGVIPGNMADSCFVVRGKGLAQSLNSASHGAGRRMSRTAAKSQFNWKDWRQHLAEKNVRLLAGGLDEVPGAYKNIHEVMSHQTDLVDIIGEFHPRIVMMCGDGSPSED